MMISRQSMEKKKPAVRVSVDYDSEENVWFAKSSARILDGIAKVKAFFQGQFHAEPDGLQSPGVFPSSIGIFCKNLFVDYDFNQNDTLGGINYDFKNCSFSYKHALVSGNGHIVAKTWLPSDPDYSVEVEGDLFTRNIFQSPEFSLENNGQRFDLRTTLDFPHGRLFYAASDRSEEEYSIDDVRGYGILLEKNFNDFSRGKVEYSQARSDLFLKYYYKDKEITFKPTIGLPSTNLILNLKRKTDDGHKLSLMYAPRDAAWEAVYKYKPEDKKYKIKAGYNSTATTSFVSLWVGDEGEGARKGPFNAKGQIMLQYDHSSGERILMYTFKKRWDFL